MLNFSSPYASLSSFGQLGSGTYGAGQPAMLPQLLPDVSAPAPAIATPVATPGWTSGFDLPAGVMPGSSLWDNFSNLFKGAIGTKEAPGWGGMALGGAQALGSTFLGMKQYGLAKQQLEQSKKEFELNYNAQKNMVNSQMEDRQNARNAATPGMQSTAEYMAKWGIK
jgi:hypothetical protein